MSYISYKRVNDGYYLIYQLPSYSLIVLLYLNNRRNIEFIILDRLHLLEFHTRSI